MSKVSVVYWSQSGNTQAMAEAVAAGITEAGKEAEVVYVSDVNVADLTAEKAFALGCPAMGAEVRQDHRTVWFLWLGRRAVDARVGRARDR